MRFVFLTVWFGGGSSEGKVARAWDFSGRRTEFEYETAAPFRLLRTKWMASASLSNNTVADSVSMAYDQNDRVTSVVDTRVDSSVWGGRTFLYGYHNDRLTTVTWPDNAVFSHTYDSQGRRQTMTDPDGNTTTYGYAGDHLAASQAGERGLASVTHGMGASGYGTGLGTYNYVRDSRGRLASLLGPHGTQQDWWYDGHGRLAGLRVHSTMNGGGASSPLHEEAYAYDALDRRTRADYAAQFGGGGASGVATKREWGYDGAGRLAREERFASAGSSAWSALWGRAWGYDAAGNRGFTARFDGATTVTSNPQEPAVFNAWNQRVEDWWAGGYGFLQYDDEGNLTYRMQDETNFFWDRSNRLVLVMGGVLPNVGTGEVHYGYDPSGRLIDRTGEDGVTEKRYYADGLSPVSVKRWDGALNAGAGGWKTVRTALHLPGGIGHVAAEREPTAWTSSGAVVPTAGDFCSSHKS